MILPDRFRERLDSYLKENKDIPAEGFWESFDDPRDTAGLRFNLSKTNAESLKDILKELAVTNDPVLWCDGAYYHTEENPGRDPLYHAGVFYPQEASAMLPAQVLNAKPGDIVLDMCAAPGGKACRIGEDLRGKGLLVANEINYERSKALLRNIERTGITNSVILNEDPENIAAHLPGFFDKILIDAPCSGEGMFRRDPNAVRSWEKFGPEKVIPIQKMILDSSAAALKDGGEIVYSTCTFNPDENENMIGGFLKDHPEFSIIPHPEIRGITHNPDGSMRVWPHISRGDGHFCVHMRKSGELVPGIRDPRPEPKYRRKKEGIYTYNKSIEVMNGFFKDILTPEAMKELKEFMSRGVVMHGNGIYKLPLPESYLNGLKTVKTGWFPGEIKQTEYDKVFIPSNSLPLTLRKEQIREDSIIDLKRDDERCLRYLKGETINLTEEEVSRLKKKGTVVVALSGFPAGLGKVTASNIKNMYPKAWRLL